MSEILCIHVGQAGVQIGNEVTELICQEHGVAEDGCWIPDKSPIQFENTDVFFKTTREGKQMFRSIYVDLEPTVVDEVRKGKYCQLFHPQNLITGKEDASNNFARGFYGNRHLNSSNNTQIVDNVIDRIRKTVEECNALQGFLIFHSLGGGTGSGYESHLLKSIKENFSQIAMELSVLPSDRMSTSTVEIYNTVLAMHAKMELPYFSVMFQNEALYQICARNLGVYEPRYSNLNRLISHVISSVTSARRFPNSSYSGIGDIATNLVLNPRLHFASASFAPLVAKEHAPYENFDVSETTRSCFDPKNQFLINDNEKGKYLGCNMSYRGDVHTSSIYQAKKELTHTTCPNNFIHWYLRSIKSSISLRKPVVTLNDDIAESPRTASLLFNSTGFARYWELIIRKFNLMFDKRAFVDWFMKEGLEEGEFIEARDDIIQLQEDYAKEDPYVVPNSV